MLDHGGQFTYSIILVGISIHDIIKTDPNSSFPDPSSDMTTHMFMVFHAGLNFPALVSGYDKEPAYDLHLQG